MKVLLIAIMTLLWNSPGFDCVNGKSEGNLPGGKTSSSGNFCIDIIGQSQWGERLAASGGVVNEDLLKLFELLRERFKLQFKQKSKTQYLMALVRIEGSKVAFQIQLNAIDSKTYQFKSSKVFSKAIANAFNNIKSPKENDALRLFVATLSCSTITITP